MSVEVPMRTLTLKTDNADIWGIKWDACSCVPPRPAPRPVSWWWSEARSEANEFAMEHGSPLGLFCGGGARLALGQSTSGGARLASRPVTWRSSAASSAANHCGGSRFASRHVYTWWWREACAGPITLRFSRACLSACHVVMGPGSRSASGVTWLALGNHFAVGSVL